MVPTMTALCLAALLFLQACLVSSFLSSASTKHHSTHHSHEPLHQSTDTNPTTTNTASQKSAILFLHGLGDTSEGWSQLTSALPNIRPSLSSLDVTYVFPPAHMVGITVNGGEQMPGWFDVYDWPIGIDAKDDPRGLALSAKRIEQIVDQLRDEEGIDPSRIVLGGFGQGGAVALMAAYNRRKVDAAPFAGCCVLSGWLPMKDYLNVEEKTAGATPLFWAHGQYDDKILFEQQILGVKKLKSVGVDVTAKAYPVGHESANFEEIEDMAEFIERVLGSGKRSQTVKWANGEEVNNSYNDGDDLERSPTSSSGEKDDAYWNEVLYYVCALGMESGQQVTK
jgi:lysophospholipase-2